MNKKRHNDLHVTARYLSQWKPQKLPSSQPITAH